MVGKPCTVFIFSMEINRVVQIRIFVRKKVKKLEFLPNYWKNGIQIVVFLTQVFDITLLYNQHQTRIKIYLGQLPEMALIELNGSL